MAHPLQDYIGYYIIQILKAHRSHAEPAFSEIGLYLGQEMLLYQLWEEEGLTQSQLGETLCVDPSTVTKTLQRLEQAGIVERRQDSEDARVSRVYLTPKGRALQPSVQAIWAHLEVLTVQGLSEVELALLRRLLDQIQRNLEK